MPWATSDRRDRLPADWEQRRQSVKRRAGGRCEKTTNGKRCPQPGTECDHRDRGDDHRLSNLQWLCTDHHRAKTIAEAQQARNAMRAARYRPAEKHPGALR